MHSSPVSDDPRILISLLDSTFCVSLKDLWVDSIEVACCESCDRQSDLTPLCTMCQLESLPISS
ncbi:unnamed protein product [Haemonchus placei]|uniref:PRT6_C domain-containing protein n=1 Tax=Haemonchus placei TaxID=6290 RepID=A0A0N4X8S6_HAEPC|nr:unnamed protein product [Haemonchus placei]